jgi:centriolar protein POC1
MNSSAMSNGNIRSIYDIQTNNQQTYSSHLANTLNHIVQQLDILTKTVSILETRLTMTESKLQKINNKEQNNE